MDEVNTAKRLSEKTGYWINEIRLDDSDAIQEIMYSVYSPVRNVGFTISVSPSLISDKMFDMAAYLKKEMDRACEGVQARKGYEGCRTKMGGNPPGDIDSTA